MEKPTESEFEQFLASLDGWSPIETAPTQGQLVNLLYPPPRGRTIDCFWSDDPAHVGWWWRSPIWENGELQPESEGSWNCYPNMQPTHWRWPPASPAVEKAMARFRKKLAEMKDKAIPTVNG